MKTVWALVGLALVLFTTIVSANRYRRFLLDKLKKESPSFRIRCPIAWSNKDKIKLFLLKENNVRMEIPSIHGIWDSFLVEVNVLNRNSEFICSVAHTNGEEEEIKIYFDIDDKIPEIQKLKVNSTTVIDAKVGDNVRLSCSDENTNDLAWFDPDLLRLNYSGSVWEISKMREMDFGDYFCGRLSGLTNSVLEVKKFVVKLATVDYEPDIQKADSEKIFPVFRLGDRVEYKPPKSHLISRRIAWEKPAGTVWVNEGRFFYMGVFVPIMTRQEFYSTITDRSDPSFRAVERTLFESEKMAKRTFNVQIVPRQISVVTGSPVELRCNNTENYKMKWWFQQSPNHKLTDLRKGLEVRKEEMYSILRIPEARLDDAGSYVCDAKRASEKTVVEVRQKPELQVTPSEIVIRPGGTASFLCQLIGATGKVVWQRKDKRSFQVDLESRIGGDTQALLVISSVPKAHNGTVYECYHNVESKSAIVLVRDICGDGERSCKNGQCIKEQSFCNGIKDCEDNSDEDPISCVQCQPNQRACLKNNHMKPKQNCVTAHWFCDGENDCGNGFDEMNCPQTDKNTCLASYFACKDNQTLIPRVSWCDTDINCPGGDDEVNCRAPSVIYPEQDTTYVVQANRTVSMVCEVVSVPTSTITWRYNWGELPSRMQFQITQTGTDCSRMKSVLNIHNMHPDFAGVYTCEAVSRGRSMAPDYTIFVTTGVLCKKPYFNDAAWFKEMCLKCYCSNITDECTSAIGYFKSPNPKVSKTSKAFLMNYISMKILEISRSYNFFDKTSQSYKFDGKTYADVVSSPQLFLTSDFSLSGSWLTSYGYYMNVKMKLSGEQFIDIPGPVVVIKGQNKQNLFWCPSENSPVIYTAKEGYVNNIKLSLWEKENWFTDSDCIQSASREDMLKVFTKVTSLMIRIKHYTNQTEFQFYNISLEHAVPGEKDEHKGVGIPRIEMCKCPFPYDGLSCEKCVSGYEKNAANECVVKCPLNCQQCLVGGECVKCTGNRSGPKCLQCKPGFVRSSTESLREDCVKCPCQETLNSTLVSNDCVHDLAGTVKCKCTGNEVNDPSCDLCLNKPLSNDIKLLCTVRNKTENPSCNKEGTQKIFENGQCECKTSYKGSSCSECETGYFEYFGKCLRCFCSNTTDSCQSGNLYGFDNLTLNSKEFGVKVKLMNRHLSGMYESDNAEKSLNVNSTTNSITVSSNPNGNGLVYITLSIKNMTNPNDINCYTMFYGGKISFKYEYNTDKLKQLVYPDTAPFLEIESAKLGRIFVTLKYNHETKKMEADFMEGGVPLWRHQDDKIKVDREMLLRALMTSQQITIGFPFDNNLVKNVRISDLNIEYAKPDKGSARRAPVEMCFCPPNTAGIKCETCSRSGFQSVVSVKPGFPDFVCGECSTPECKACSSGSYNYDFVLNKNYSQCQPGIEITTKSRTVFVNKGELLILPCEAKSYRGGVAVHKWTKDSGNDNLITERLMNPDGTANNILFINDVKLSDSGLYKCSVANLISNDSQEFYVVVKDQDPRLSVQIKVSSESDKKAVFNVSIESPKSPTDYNIVWAVVRDGKKITEKSSQVKVQKKDSFFIVEIQIPENTTAGMQLHGTVTGSRIDNPFFYEIRQNIRRNITLTTDPVAVADQKIVKLKFLESRRVKVLVNPEIRTETFWYKVLPNGTEVALPKGMSKDKNDLLIWTASENHNGRYVGYVINTDAGTKVGKVEVEIKVSGMNPDMKTDLLNQTEAINATIKLYVPHSDYCSQQKWELLDPEINKTIDITKFVWRISDSEVIVHYNVGLGKSIRFTCMAIEESESVGSVKVTLDSKYTMAKIVETFNNSFFPSSIQCYDMNTIYPSNITWTFKGKPVTMTFVSINTTGDSIVDWQNVGGFSPELHEGLYKCKIENAYHSSEKEIYIPDMTSNKTNIPVYIKIVSSTHPIVSVNNSVAIVVSAEQKFQITALLYGRPATNAKIEWFVNNQTVSTKDSGKYFTTFEVEKSPTTTGSTVYEARVQLENGTVLTTKIVLITEKSPMAVKVFGLNSRGSIEILEGDSRSVKCSLIENVNNKEMEVSEGNVEWILHDQFGHLLVVKDIRFIKYTSNSKVLDISVANAKLNEVVGQCRITHQGKIYESQFFEFDVNKRNIDLRIRFIGLTEGKYVDNDEGSTSQVICEAYDENSNRKLPSVIYNWNMVYNKDNKGINWQKMIPDNEKITFGGLVYQPPENASTGRCHADYFGKMKLSDEFTFRIKKKDETAKLPQLKIEVTFDENRQPYPVSVVCIDTNTKEPSKFSVNVSNVNFDKSLIATTDKSLIINFTANGSLFDPYTHSGIYTFTITNQYGVFSKAILLPQENNKFENYTTRLEITTSIGEIKNNFIRVKNGQKIKLVCKFYGHPNPTSLKWMSNVLQHSKDIQTHDYWTSMEISEFNRLQNGGKYQCLAQSHQGLISKEVTLEGYDFGVNIEIVTEHNKPLPRTNSYKQGENLVFNIVATDRYTNEPYNETQGKWEIRILPSKNFTDLDAKSTNESVSIVDNKLIINKVSKSQRIEIRYRIQNGSNEFTSRSVFINIEENELLLPKPKFNIIYSGSSLYPTEVQCVDENFSEQSKVKITRMGGKDVENVQIAFEPNKSVLKWENDPFAPSYDQGRYRCLARNRFNEKSVDIDLPEINKGKGESFVRFESRVNNIVVKDNKKQVEIVEGSTLKIVCNYYGSRPPMTDVEIVFEKKDGESQAATKFASRSMTKKYFSEIFIEKLNASIHQGTYICRSRNATHSLEDTLEIQGIVPGIEVVVKNLDSDKNIILKLGSNRSLSCTSIDTVTKKEPANSSYKWILENANGTILPLKLLSKSSVEMRDSVVLDTVIRNNIVRGRCEVTSINGTFYSKYFEVKTEDDEEKKPLINCTVTLNEDQSLPVLLVCRDERQEKSNVTISLVGKSISNEVNITQNENVISLSFPKETDNPLALVGTYKCKSSSKYGSSEISIEIKYAPKPKPVKVKIESSSHKIAVFGGVKQITLPFEVKMELDCVYSGDHKPITVDWFLKEGSDEKLTKLTKEKNSFGLEVYQKRSDCLSVATKGFLIKGLRTLVCSAEDSIKANASDKIIIEIFLTGIKIDISGLDSNGNLKADIGSDTQLTFRVSDLQGDKDVTKEFTANWVFTKPDGSNFQAKNLAKKVDIMDNTIKLNQILPLPSEMTGFIVVSNGTHNFTSPQFTIVTTENESRIPKAVFTKEHVGRKNFPSKIICRDERVSESTVTIIFKGTNPIPKEWIKSQTNSAEITFPLEINDFSAYEGSYMCTAENKYGKQIANLGVDYLEPLHVSFNSTLHTVMGDDPTNFSVTVRRNRKFEMDCFVRGEPDPIVKLYIQTAPTNPDLPVPGIRSELSLGNEGPYKVTKISKNHYQIKGESYSQSPPASFFCEATLNNQKAISSVNVTDIADKYTAKVIVVNQTNTRGLVAFSGQPFKIGCELRDLTNKKIEPKRLNWKFSSQQLEDIHPSNLAKNVVENKDSIILNGLEMTLGNVIRGKCVAYPDESTDILSEEFTFFIKEYPRIESVLFDQIAPLSRSNLVSPQNFTYNAEDPCEFKCSPKIFNHIDPPVVKWEKCQDDDCNSTKKLDSLQLPAGASTYLDVGHYRCVVELTFNGKLIETKKASLFLDRRAAPKTSARTSIIFKKRNNLQLSCPEKYHYPEGNVTWTFSPLNKDTPSNLPKESSITSNERVYSLEVKRPLFVEYSGVYTCNITNIYGSGGASFNVTITP